MELHFILACISVNIISDGLRWDYISYCIGERVMVCMACISVNIISDGLRWDAAQVAAAQILGRMQCAYCITLSPEIHPG